MALTAMQVKTAVAGEGKRKKLSDGRGLLLIVAPNGSKWWRYRYTTNGRERLLSLGTYPVMSLAQARLARDAAAALRAQGIDPMGGATVASSGDTLEKLAKDWFAAKSTNWAPENATRVWGRVQNNILPLLGNRAPDDIEPTDVLTMLQPIQDRRAFETAHRVRGYLSRIYRYGIASQRAKRDPAADIRDALATPPAPKHFAAIIDPVKLGQMMRDIKDYRGRWWAVQPAMQLTPYLLVRPGTLRQMEWGDIDLPAREWQTRSLKGSKLETLVPLPSQAIDIIRYCKEFSGGGRYVFPGPRSPSRPLSENAVNQAFRTMGWGGDEVTAHGFRATARTLLDETLGWRVDWIETQLGHSVRDPNGRAYNRTVFIDERREMMQAWADYLDGL